jgi:D-alanyl-D-alanine carboxypeptidase
MKKVGNVLCLLWLLVPSIMFGQNDFNRSKMDSLLNMYEQKNRLMFSLAISQDGNTIYKKAIGYAWVDGDKKTPSNTETKYRIGSISKTFTAVMILQLIEEGKLKLNTPLSKFYPKFLNAKKITIEHLLMHRSGIHNFTDDPDYVNYMTIPKTNAEMMDIFMKLPSDFEPGAKHLYSNTGYVLLGYIVEKLTKQKYADALAQRITDKIGLRNTYCGTAASESKNEARSFFFNGKNWEAVYQTDMSIPGGAGAIVSTAEDLTDFIEAIFNYSLLKKETVEQMVIQKDGYGMGVFNIPFYDRTATGHNGKLDNFESFMGYFPSDRMAIGLSVNGANADISELVIGVLSICFHRPFQIPQFYTVDVPETLLDEYSGIYYSGTMQLNFYITREGNVIVGQAEGQSSFPLEAKSTNKFEYASAHIEIEFQRNAENIVHQFLLKQGGMEFIFQKIK